MASDRQPIRARLYAGQNLPCDIKPQQTRGSFFSAASFYIRMRRISDRLGLLVLCTGLLLYETTTAANITLGFTTDMWVGSYYPATAIQIALDTIRRRGALVDDNFR